MAATKTIKQRILDKAKRNKGTGCLEWTAHKRRGYGSIKHEGKLKYAHRLSYELFVGPVPKGALVCHRCDNPACIEPSHLFTGSTLDNVRDKVRKGRQPRGEQINTAKLSESQVREIRKRYSQGGHTHHTLAAEYGVTYGLIGHITTGRIWKHVS